MKRTKTIVVTVLAVAAVVAAIGISLTDFFAGACGFMVALGLLSLVGDIVYFRQMRPEIDPDQWSLDLLGQGSAKILYEVAGSEVLDIVSVLLLGGIVTGTGIYRHPEAFVTGMFFFFASVVLLAILHSLVAQLHRDESEEDEA